MNCMHLLLRTLVLLFTSSRRTPVSIWDTSSLPLRVLPTDIDIALHVNNGMYFLLDGPGPLRPHGPQRNLEDDAPRAAGRPVAAGETIAFRRSLQLWQQYTIESKIIGLDSKAIYFEQRMVVDGEVYARAYIATRLVSKGRPVSQEEIIREFGEPAGGSGAARNGSTNGAKPTRCPVPAARPRTSGPEAGARQPDVPTAKCRGHSHACSRTVDSWLP